MPSYTRYGPLRQRFQEKNSKKRNAKSSGSYYLNRGLISQNNSAEISVVNDASSRKSLPRTGSYESASNPQAAMSDMPTKGTHSVVVEEDGVPAREWQPTDSTVNASNSNSQAIKSDVNEMNEKVENLESDSQAGKSPTTTNEIVENLEPDPRAGKSPSTPNPSPVATDSPPIVPSNLPTANIGIDNQSSTEKRDQLSHNKSSESSVGTYGQLEMSNSNAGSQASKKGTKSFDKGDAKSICSAVNLQQMHESTTKEESSNSTKKPAFVVTPPTDGCCSDSKSATDESTSTTSTGTSAAQKTIDRGSLGDLTYRRLSKSVSFSNTVYKMKDLRDGFLFQRVKFRKKPVDEKCTIPTDEPRLCDEEQSLHSSTTMDSSHLCHPLESSLTEAHPTENSERKIGPSSSLDVDAVGFNQDTLESEINSLLSGASGSFLDDDAEQSEINSSPGVASGSFLDDASEQFEIHSLASHRSVNKAACKPLGIITIHPTDKTAPPVGNGEQVLVEGIEIIYEDYLELAQSTIGRVSVPEEDLSYCQSDRSVHNVSEECTSFKNQNSGDPENTEEQVSALQDNPDTKGERSSSENSGDGIQTIRSHDGDCGEYKTENENGDDSSSNRTAVKLSKIEGVLNRADVKLSKIEVVLNHLERRLAPQKALVQAELNLLKRTKTLDISRISKVKKANAALLDTVKANIAEMEAVMAERAEQRKLVDSEKTMEEKMDENFNLVKEALQKQTQFEQALSHLMERLEKNSPGTSQAGEKVGSPATLPAAELVGSVKSVVLPPTVKKNLATS